MSDSASIEHQGWLTTGEPVAADEPLRLFAMWFEEAGRTEAVDPNAMAVATADADGAPNVRMLLLKGFLVVAVGGIGSNSGALIAALVIGLVEATTARMLTPGLQEAVSFAVVLLLLLVRPQGIFGTATGRSV